MSKIKSYLSINLLLVIVLFVIVSCSDSKEVLPKEEKQAEIEEPSIDYQAIMLEKYVVEEQFEEQEGILWKATDSTFAVQIENRGWVEFSTGNLPLAEQIFREYKHGENSVYSYGRNGSAKQVPVVFSGAKVKAKADGEESYYLLDIDHRCSDNLIRENDELIVYIKHFKDSTFKLYPPNDLYATNNYMYGPDNAMGYRLCHANTEQFESLPEGWAVIKGDAYERLVPPSEFEKSFGVNYSFPSDFELHSAVPTNLGEIVERLKVDSIREVTDFETSGKSRLFVYDQLDEVFITLTGYFSTNPLAGNPENPGMLPPYYLLVHDPESLLSQYKAAWEENASEAFSMELSIKGKIYSLKGFPKIFEIEQLEY